MGISVSILLGWVTPSSGWTAQMDGNFATCVHIFSLYQGPEASQELSSQKEKSSFQKKMCFAPKFEWSVLQYPSRSLRKTSHRIPPSPDTSCSIGSAGSFGLSRRVALAAYWMHPRAFSCPGIYSHLPYMSQAALQVDQLDEHTL